MKKTFCSAAGLVLTALFCFVAARGSAVAKPFSGYYINNSGDSIVCEIVFKDWGINPTAITVVEGGVTHAFSPSDIRGFGVTGYADYRSATVSYHLNGISGINIPWEYSDSTETKRSFLKILVDGKYSLCELVTALRPYYFIRKDDGEYSELLYRVRERQLVIEEDRRYKNTFFELFAGEGMSADYARAIRAAAYKDRELEKLADALNKKYGRRATNVAVRKSPTGTLIQGDLFAGAMMNMYLTPVDGHFVRTTLSNSVSFSGGVNFLYYAPAHFNSLAIGASVGYNRYQSSYTMSDSVTSYESPREFKHSDFTETISIRHAVWFCDLYALYFLNPSSKQRFYVKGGANVILRSDKYASVEAAFHSVSSGKTNNVPYSGWEESGAGMMIALGFVGFDLNVGAGITMGRSRLELNYYSPANLSADADKRFRAATLGAYYYFTVFR